MRPASSQKPLLDEATQASRVGRGVRSLAQDPPGWHKRSNVLKLFTKVRAAQGPWPCCTSGMAETHAAADIPFDRFIATYRAKYPKASSARPRTGSTVDLDDFPAEHWVHLRTTDPIESVSGSVPPHRSDHGLCAAGSVGTRRRSTASATTHYRRLTRQRCWLSGAPNAIQHTPALAHQCRSSSFEALPPWLFGIFPNRGR